ncbi:hypothetical protein BCR44DRAFT_1424518 [Catenaria anguillulae PL171]|uniref:Uncharacterized protein n=1 Tax=Catenaria anguillulae PL171 TaxID=765915 RepID=A0A1Y2HZX1_9FUNG|nr:hypothetical protein BCR44DRAFT_1424518 [Catenaria anguillulae PL171]
MGNKGVFINRAYDPRPESPAATAQFQLMRDVTNAKPVSPNGSPNMSKGDLVERLNAAEADASAGTSTAAGLRHPPGRASMSNPLACSSRSIDISLDSDDDEAQYSPTRQEIGAFAMPSDIRPLPSSVVGPDSLSPMIASRDLSSAASLAAPGDASTLSSSPVLPELGDTPTPSAGVPEPVISADDAEMLSLAFRESLMGSRASLDGKSLRSMQSGPLRSMDREASSSLSRQLSPALEGRLLPPVAPEPTAATEVSLSRS